jgi:hypothetical protein
MLFEDCHFDKGPVVVTPSIQLSPVQTKTSYSSHRFNTTLLCQPRLYEWYIVHGIFVTCENLACCVNVVLVKTMLSSHSQQTVTKCDPSHSNQ